MIVPPAPGAGVVHVIGPGFGFHETNVIVPGSVSCRVTICALFVDGFVSVIVKVTFVPGPADVGPLFVTKMSACGGNGVEVAVAAELFSLRGSGVSLKTVAMLVNVVPSGVPVGM